MNTSLVALTTKLAERFEIAGNGADIAEALKSTAFRAKDPVTDAQLFALLAVAHEYGLNPWTRELWAFPSERGIVPIVSIDGWIRIVNEHPQCDGWEFEHEPNNEWVTCKQFRRDRTRPLPATEYLAECKRGTEPWNKMPRRMLRHKAFIQSARLAYGFALYDEEEGAAAAGVVIDAETGEITGQEPKGPRRKSEKQQPVDVTPTPTPAPAPAADQAAGPTPSPAPAGNSGNGGGGISGGQVAYLRNKLKSAGLAESTITDRFQVASIELLSAEAFDEVKAELLAMA
jgi:phage recombination protein Bet